MSLSGNDTTNEEPGDGPPRYRINLELVDGRRAVLEVPGACAMSGGGIDPGPGRVSIYQRDPSSPKGYRLESARLFDDIAELAGGGVELDVDIEVLVE